MSHPYIDLETRDKLIRHAIEMIDAISNRYESGLVDTLGFFEELGHWTRETNEMLQTAVNSKTAQGFNACPMVEDKKLFLMNLIDNDRKRVVLS